jgi:hypothetical protein
MQRRTARFTGPGCCFREGVAQKTRNRCRRRVRQAYDAQPGPPAILIMKQSLMEGFQGCDRRPDRKPTIKPFTYDDRCDRPGRRQKQSLFARNRVSPRRVSAAVCHLMPIMNRWTHCSAGPTAARIACAGNIRTRRNFGRWKMSPAARQRRFDLRCLRRRLKISSPSRGCVRAVFDRSAN